VRLSVALGRYPHNGALLDGRMAPVLASLDLAEIRPISRAFAPMVRERRFDVSEMAIVTFLMAKAWGKPLVLLPVAVAARFQEAALLCRADGAIRYAREQGLLPREMTVEEAWEGLPAGLG